MLDWLAPSNRCPHNSLLSRLADSFVCAGTPLLPTTFDAFTKAYGYHAFPYDGGFALRKHVLGNVYTSNNAPPGVLIPLHHEMSYVNSYPLILFFYCDIPAKEGGETPMALSNVIYRKMAERDPDFVKRLEIDGLRYVRVAPDGDDVI